MYLKCVKEFHLFLDVIYQIKISRNLTLVIISKMKIMIILHKFTSENTNDFTIINYDEVAEEYKKNKEKKD